MHWEVAGRGAAAACGAAGADAARGDLPAPASGCVSPAGADGELLKSCSRLTYTRGNETLAAAAAVSSRPAATARVVVSTRRSRHRQSQGTYPGTPSSLTHPSLLCVVLRDHLMDNGLYFMYKTKPMCAVARIPSSRMMPSTPWPR